MKKIILPFLCLILASTAFSQARFEKAYMVTAPGDTTFGFIKHNTYSELAQSVEFRQSDTMVNAVSYTPETLFAFGFLPGDQFEAVQYTDPLDESAPKREFARVALEGKYSVFVLARKLLSNYLIKTEDTAYVLYDEDVDYSKKVIRLGNYRNMLAFLSRDCKTSYAEFEKVPFSEGAILREIEKLNKCSNSTSVVHKSKAIWKKSVVVYAGGFSIKDKWMQRSGGAEIRFRKMNLSRKLFFTTGLHYASTTEYRKQFSSFYNRVLLTERNTTVYSVPAQLHYTFLERAVQPYTYLGFAAAYRNKNYKSQFAFDERLQGNYGVSFLYGIGVEIYPVSFIAIKADWRYELLLQYPTLGVAVRL